MSYCVTCYVEITVGRGIRSQCKACQFWTKVDKTGPCHLWTRSKDEKGYGRFQGRQAHNVAWELLHGPIPDGKKILHTCDNRACCKDEHLWLGTQQDNITDMVAKGRHRNKYTGPMMKS